MRVKAAPEDYTQSDAVAYCTSKGMHLSTWAELYRIAYDDYNNGGSQIITKRDFYNTSDKGLYLALPGSGTVPSVGSSPAKSICVK